jgi:hypothetical protein
VGIRVGKSSGLNQLKCGVDPLELDASGICCKAPIRLGLTAQLIALACSKPPPGYARWTLRLLADKVVERKIVVRTGNGRTRWCILTAEFGSRRHGATQLEDR